MTIDELVNANALEACGVHPAAHGTYGGVSRYPGPIAADDSVLLDYLETKTREAKHGLSRRITEVLEKQMREDIEKYKQEGGVRVASQIGRAVSVDGNSCMITTSFSTKGAETMIYEVAVEVEKDGKREVYVSPKAVSASSEFEAIWKVAQMNVGDACGKIHIAVRRFG